MSSSSFDESLSSPEESIGDFFACSFKKQENPSILIQDMPVALFINELQEIDGERSVIIRHSNQKAEEISAKLWESYEGYDPEKGIVGMDLKNMPGKGFDDHWKRLTTVLSSGTIIEQEDIVNVVLVVDGIEKESEIILHSKLIPLTQNRVMVLVEEKQKPSKNNGEKEAKALSDLKNSLDSSRNTLSPNLEVPADISTLIGHLITKSARGEYTKQFFISYRNFISPSSLFQKLIDHFNSLKDKPECQNNTYYVLKTWLSEHYYDFIGDPELLDSMESFIRSLSTDNRHMEEASHLRALMAEKAVKEFNKLSVGRTLIEHITDDTYDVFSEKCRTIANQLTLLAFDKFKMIKRQELYSQSWCSKDLSLSPNVRSLIAHHNTINRWVGSEILSERNSSIRTQKLRKFIKIAWIAYGYRDYETTFAVCVGLLRNEVYRIGHTWKDLDKPTKKKWKRLRAFIDLKENYKNYRNTMKKLLPQDGGCDDAKNVLPYIGIYLRDLTCLEENENFTEIGSVNVFKMRLFASLVMNVQNAQQSIFNFPRNSKIISFLTHDMTLLDDKKLFEMSKLCEQKMSRTFLTPQNSGDFEGAFKRTESDPLLVVVNPVFGVVVKRLTRK